MHSRLLLLPALLGASSLLFSGCQGLGPVEGPGAFGDGNANRAAADINRAGTASTAGSFATGSPDAAIARATTHVIAVHQATVQQRQLAEQRARASYARLVARQKAAAKAQKPRQPGAKVAAYKIPRVPRYICVDTSKDRNTAPSAAKAVMIWDTQSQEIVGNNVYDINTPPPVGSTSRFETYSAEYVGAGL